MFHYQLHNECQAAISDLFKKPDITKLEYLNTYELLTQESIAEFLRDSAILVQRH